MDTDDVLEIGSDDDTEEEPLLSRCFCENILYTDLGVEGRCERMVQRKALKSGSVQMFSGFCNTCNESMLGVKAALAGKIRGVEASHGAGPSGSGSGSKQCGEIKKPVTLITWGTAALRKRSEKCMENIQHAIFDTLLANPTSTTTKDGLGAICASNVLELCVCVPEFEPVGDYNVPRSYNFFFTLGAAEQQFLVDCALKGISTTCEERPDIGSLSWNGVSVLVVLPLADNVALGLPQSVHEQPPHLDMDAACFQVGLALSDGHPTTQYYTGNAMGPEEALAKLSLSCPTTRRQLLNDGFFNCFCELLAPLPELLRNMSYMTKTGRWCFGEGYVMAGSCIHKAPRPPEEGYESMRAVMFIAGTPKTRPMAYDTDEQWTAPVMLGNLVKRCTTQEGKKELINAQIRYFTAYRLYGFDVKDHVMQDEALYAALGALGKATEAVYKDLLNK